MTELRALRRVARLVAAMTADKDRNDVADRARRIRGSTTAVVVRSAKLRDLLDALAEADEARAEQ